MMKRSLLVSAVAGTLGVMAVGCMPEASGIIASAPAVVPAQSGRIPATGKYILYRVSAVDATTGKPTSVTPVGQYELQEGDHVRFEWVSDKETADTPNAHMDLIVYAGSTQQNLGPLTMPQEKYFFATEDGFNHYWTFEPAFGFYNKVTLQQ